LDGDVCRIMLGREGPGRSPPITVVVFSAVTPVARLVRDEVAIGGVAAEGPFRPGGQG
jgi:hypothetical protein